MLNLYEEQTMSSILVNAHSEAQGHAVFVVVVVVVSDLLMLLSPSVSVRWHPLCPDWGTV